MLELKYSLSVLPRDRDFGCRSYIRRREPRRCRTIYIFQCKYTVIMAGDRQQKLPSFLNQPNFLQCGGVISVVDPNSFFSDLDPQIIFFGFGFGFGYGFGFLD
jgi:hypothetical protein